MQKVLTSAQMREVDRLTTEKYGIPSIVLMENAAHAVANVITERLGGSVERKRILIICGKGNNGGDGAALARILWQRGAACLVALLGTVSDTRGDARVNFEMVKQIAALQNGFFNLTAPYLGLVEVLTKEDVSNLFLLKDEDVCVDALMGTGLSGKLKSDYSKVVTKLNNVRLDGRKSLIVSVDLPSGVSADTGEMDVDVSDDLVQSQSRADVALPDVTVTFTAPKLGNVLPPASRCSQELVVAQIGTPPRLVDNVNSTVFVAESADAAAWLQSTFFRDDSYKNKRGHAFLIAGSEDYSGAAVLAGNSAMRSGVGLVTLAAPKECKPEIASRLLPDVILKGLDTEPELMDKADAIAIGCGLSATDPAIEKLVRDVVATREVPVIIDAGALGFYAPMQKSAREQGRNTQLPDYALAHPQASAVGPPLIFTPHEGEFMRLLGNDDKDAIKDRVAAVRDFATTHNVILVLKGERVLIGAPDGRVVVNPTGNSGLGKAGNGDTLTGILAGFVAQANAMDIDIFETVVAAVYVAGMAGDVAEKKFGKRVMTATDVRECLVDVFAEFKMIS